MKNLFCLLLITGSFFLSSCHSKKTAVVESLSGDGKLKIRVEGNRTVLFDPFKTTLMVKRKGVVIGKLQFEIVANDLNWENVKFEWQSNTDCTVTFEQMDLINRSFRIIANDEGVKLYELEI